MVGENADVAFDAGGRCASGAHGHTVEGYVAGTDAVDVEQAQQVFEVGGNTEVDVETAVAIVDGLAAVEGWMSRLKSEFHHPRAEGARGIVAHAFCQVGTVDVMHITIDRVGFRIGKFGGKRGHDVVGREKVVGVQYADDIARSHCDSLVHRIVDASVRLTDVAQTPSVKRLKFADNLHRVV